MLSGFMHSVIMLNVVAPLFRFIGDLSVKVSLLLL